jgi:hypothetical protein
MARGLPLEHHPLEDSKSKVVLRRFRLRGRAEFLGQICQIDPVRPREQKVTRGATAQRIFFGAALSCAYGCAYGGWPPKRRRSSFLMGRVWQRNERRVDNAKNIGPAANL